MAGENEILACSASGMSHGRIVFPVVLLGVVLSVLMFFLSNFLVPGFYRAAAAIVEKDAIRLILGAVEQGETVEQFGGAQLFADAATIAPAPVLEDSDVQPESMLSLSGVALRHGNQSDSTAKRADMLLFRVDGETWITLRLHDVVHFDALAGRMFAVEDWSLPAVKIPHALSEEPRFMTLPRLLRIWRAPELFEQVQQRRHRLIRMMAGAAVLSEFDGRLIASSREKPVELHGMAGTVYRVWAPKVYQQMQEVIMMELGTDPVTVWIDAPGQGTRELRARRAVLTVDDRDPTALPRLVFELQQVQVHDLTSGQFAERELFTIRSAPLPAAAAAPYVQMNSEDLIERTHHAPFTNIIPLHAVKLELIKHLSRTTRRAISELNARAAASITSLLVLLLAAGLSIRMRGSMTLVVYLWTFLAAILGVILTYSGENVTIEGSTPIPGLIVTWSGQVLLLVACVVTYRKLRRQ